MKRLSLLLLAACALIACDRRAQIAQLDTARTHPAPAVPERSAYLSISSLSPDAGGMVVVAGTVVIGGDLTLGSYRVRLGYDSAKLHFLEEVPTAGMMRVVNPRAGDIVVAGASSGQSRDSTLFVLRFRADDPAGINSLVLRIDEMNDIGFTDRKETITRASKLVLDSSLAGRVIPTGASGSSGTGAPRVQNATPELSAQIIIDSISPRSGALENEKVTDITLYGRGFAARGNLVLFGDREIPGLMSERGGTVIRFPAPVIRVHEGRVPVRVKHGGVQSNLVFFTVKDDK